MKLSEMTESKHLCSVYQHGEIKIGFKKIDQTSTGFFAEI